jgi:hypothetical protein
MTKGRHHAERDRGAKEHSQQLHALREKWPLAFPVPTQDVRPLALGVANQSPQQWTGRSNTRSACSGLGRWHRSTAGPCFPMTSASRSMVSRPKRSMRARRNWQQRCWRRRPRLSRPPSRSPHSPSAPNRPMMRGEGKGVECHHGRGTPPLPAAMARRQDTRRPRRL